MLELNPNEYCRVMTPQNVIDKFEKDTGSEINKSTVLSWFHASDFPVLKIGSRYFVFYGELLEWFDKHRTLEK